ncbi:hypothetical protein MNB_SV-15-248 [hydrothermal vent metagenome]|uniref:Uncharacterized protein n=1 Tax=hydrothermal vent metagenome TaxID=652676 RepID=A0A1W1EHM5_9ZZZZ
MKIFILIITILINLYGYTDLDFDGVDDAIDKCPNTSFEDEVGEDGCPYNKHYRGKATILLSQKIDFFK